MMFYALFITVFIIIIVLLLIRLFMLKKEIRKMEQQLSNYNERRTDKKIDISLFDRDIEKLGEQINGLIDLHMLENRKRIKMELEHKQVIANMSHDLRTPLTSIQGYIQMAGKTGILKDEQKELLKVASNRAKRLEVLIKEFFELSMIESTDYHLKLQKLNVRRIIVDVLMTYYDRFQDEEVALELHIPEQNIYILANESALHRVLENLLINAIIHSDGNVVIHLKENNDEVTLRIKNDATHLTEEDALHLFDRFYMADRSRTGSSTGLGLSIVKSLMEKMNATITSHFQQGQLTMVCKWKKVNDGDILTN